MNTEKTLVKGSPAPEFSLPSHDGKAIHLSDLRGQFVVLYFYPKDATPGCTTEACDFRDLWPSFGNAVVLGVSPDSLSSHEKFAAKYNLPFPFVRCRSRGCETVRGLRGKGVVWEKNGGNDSIYVCHRPGWNSGRRVSECESRRPRRKSPPNASLPRRIARNHRSGITQRCPKNAPQSIPKL